MRNSRKKIRLFFTILGLVFLPIVGSLAHWPTPAETSCRDIPENIVVIAPAFTPAGKNMKTGKYRPGNANHRIAQKLEECASRFKIVLTQKAVSDALSNENRLKNGVPVAQMHKDSEMPVRTLEAVCCAIERLEGYPENLTIGLIAHDKHFRRSRKALEAVLQNRKPAARIVDIHLPSYTTLDNISQCRVDIFAMIVFFETQDITRLEPAVMRVALFEALQKIVRAVAQR